MSYKKIDKNQNEIVGALRSVGASVESLAKIPNAKGVPDLLVGWHGKNYLMEIKNRDNRLTSFQEKWQRVWQGSVFNVRTIEEAFMVIGLTTKKYGEF